MFEGVEDGEILCAACPNARIVITGGTSTVRTSLFKSIRDSRKITTERLLQVVNVWEYGKGRTKRSLHLKMPLFGHTEAITCLCASNTYNVAVSGSADRTCILWDLSRLCFLRQLRGHAAPVAAVYINDVTVRLSNTCCVVVIGLDVSSSIFGGRETLRRARDRTSICGRLTEMSWRASTLQQVATNRSTASPCQPSPSGTPETFSSPEVVTASFE